MGAIGANVLVEFKIFFLFGALFLIGGIFFKLEAMEANVLVEFENVFFYLGSFFYNWGHFLKVGGQKIILGSRKSAILGIIWTPDLEWFNLSHLLT